MAGMKFEFDPNTLEYKKQSLNFWEKLIRVAGFMSMAGVFGVISMLTFAAFFDTPKEKQLQREIKNYEVHFENLNQKTELLTKVLKDLEYRDEQIYREIFEAEAIPSSVREAGFGGVNRYKYLENLDNEQTLKETYQKVDQLSKQVYILSKSYDEIFSLAQNKKDMLAAIPAIQPVRNKELKRVASGYGWRIHPIYKTKKFHGGLDFSAPQGTPVYVTGNGVVEKASYSRRGYGHHVVVDHGYGYKSLYAHLKGVDVKKGQELKRGEKIGEVGNTGLSTAPHLHYEVHKDGKRINPINFFHNDLTPEEYEQILILANSANQSFD